MPELTPRPLPEPAVRAVGRAAGLPLVGRAVRALSLQLYGVEALRAARLGDTPPWLSPPSPEEPDRP